MTFKEDLTQLQNKFGDGNFKIFKVRHYSEKVGKQTFKQTIVEIGGFFVINKNTHVNEREGSKIFSKIKQLLKNYKAFEDDIPKK